MSTTHEANYGTIEDFKSNNFNKKFVFVGMNYNANPAMKGVNYGTSLSIPGTATIYDEKEKRLRNIRYVPGSHTIFEDEMKFESVADMEKKTQRLLFVREHTNGLCQLVVDGKDSTLLKYAMLAPYNFSSPNRDKEKRPLYWVLDLEASTKQAADGIRSVAKAISWCFDAGWDEVYSYARVLMGDVSGRDSNEVRYNLSLLAMKNPEKFEAGLKSDLTKKKFMVIDGIDKGIIKRTHNTLSWDNGAPIIIAPVGKDPVDVLVDSNDTQSTLIFTSLAMKLKSGSEEYKIDVPGDAAATKQEIGFLKEQLAKQNEMIEKLMSGSAVPVTEMNFNKGANTTPTLIPGEEMESEDKLKLWVETAKKKKAIRQAGAWFFFDAHPEIIAFKQEKIQGHKELIKLLFEERKDLGAAVKKIVAE